MWRIKVINLIHNIQMISRQQKLFHIYIFLIPDTASLTSPSLRTPSVWCWRSGWLAGGRSVNGLFIQVDCIEIDANECEWISGCKEMKLGKFWCAKIRLTDVFVCFLIVIVSNEYIPAKPQLYQLVEPVDSLHPTQAAQALITEQVRRSFLNMR